MLNDVCENIFYEFSWHTITSFSICKMHFSMKETVNKYKTDILPQKFQGVTKYYLGISIIVWGTIELLISSY